MFAAPVVDYILYGKLDAVKVLLGDLISGKVKTTLEELEAISDPVKFKQEASFNTPLRFKAGYTKPIVAFDDKKEFIRCICLHQLMLSTRSEIDQFIKGLMTNGILDFIRNNPDKSRKLLQHDNNERLTAEVVDNQFHRIFSDQGSNKRRSEEAIAFNFSHYLEDVEQGLVTSNVLDPDTEEIHTSKVKLAHVLQFVTGSDRIPAIGFDTSLTIMFDHDEPYRKLTVNTCSCTLNYSFTNRRLALRSHVILSAMLEGKQIGCYGKHGCRVGSRKVSYATIYANSFFLSKQNDLYSLFKYA